MKTLLILAALLLAAGGSALAKTAAAPSSLLPGGKANEPVNVNADKLEYFSKQQKAVYSGHVVARQGEGSLRATRLTIFFTQGGQGAGASLPTTGGDAGSQVRRMEAAGPVTIVQKDQVGTGDNGIYDHAQNRIYLNGNVSLTQGPNVVKGDQLVYDLDSGQAQVVGRVTSLFIPGNGGPAAGPGSAKKKRAPRQSARGGEGGIP